VLKVGAWDLKKIAMSGKGTRVESGGMGVGMGEGRGGEMRNRGWGSKKGGVVGGDLNAEKGG